MTKVRRSYIETEAQLEDVLTKPSPQVIEVIFNLTGDMMLLGAGGKIGPTLAIMARRAIIAAGADEQIIAVDRFFAPEVEKKLADAGIEVITIDLLGQGSLDSLPDVSNIIFMAGRKFGSTGTEPLTWALNTYLPATVVQRFKDCKIVAFSTGNVYPFVALESGGAKETDPPNPVGEYAQSCLGRERIIQYFCGVLGTLCCLIRLNYAIDLRYGVLLDVAQKVAKGIPINLRSGRVNVIWQGDVNEAVLRSFTLCESPPRLLNVTGLEIVSIRKVAEQFGQLLGKKPIFEGKEEETALLSNAAQYYELFGPPKVSLDEMVQGTAHWVLIDGPVLNKPAHYEVRNGRF